MSDGFKSKGFRNINLVGLAWVFVSFISLVILLPANGYDFYNVPGMISFLLAWFLLNLFWIVIKIAEMGFDPKKVILTPARSKIFLIYKTIGQIIAILIYSIGFASVVFPELLGKYQEIFVPGFFINIIATAVVYYQIKELAMLCPVCGSDENDSEYIKDSSVSLSFNSSKHREKLTCKKCKSSWEVVVITTST